MDFEVDLSRRAVTFAVPKAIYSADALRVAAHVFERKAKVEASESGPRYEIELAALSKSAGAPELEILAGEFANELLNQQYRFLVSAFNSKISNLIVTQALFAARGGENPPKAPEAEKTPEFKAAVALLMKNAQEEVERTMPRRLPPQGKPLAEAADA